MVPYPTRPHLTAAIRPAATPRPDAPPPASCFTSKAILLPATRRRWFILARFILASCQAAAPGRLGVQEVVQDRRRRATGFQPDLHGAGQRAGDRPPLTRRRRGPRPPSGAGRATIAASSPGRRRRCPPSTGSAATNVSSAIWMLFMAYKLHICRAIAGRRPGRLRLEAADYAGRGSRDVEPPVTRGQDRA